MKKRILKIIIVAALWLPGIVLAQDTAKLYPREWSVIQKVPSEKGGLRIGVFLFEQGMPAEHIQNVFGDPDDVIRLDTAGRHRGTIWVYPHHYFVFTTAGKLQTIKERR